LADFAEAESEDVALSLTSLIIERVHVAESDAVTASIAALKKPRLLATVSLEVSESLAVRALVIVTVMTSLVVKMSAAKLVTPLLREIESDAV